MEGLRDGWEHPSNTVVGDGDGDAAIAIWDGLDEREQRLVWFSLASLVNHYRAERGDDPDDTYGPPETEGL